MSEDKKQFLIEKKLEQEKSAVAVKPFMGLPVAYDPKSGAKGLKALIKENFEHCDQEVQVIRDSREKRGLNALSSPVIYAAKIVEDASEVELDKMYFLRVITISADGGQAHATAMERFKLANCVFLDYDLPTVDQYSNAVKSSPNFDKDTMQEYIKQFTRLKEYLDDEITAKDYIEENKTVKAKNEALKAKIAELNAKLAKGKPVDPVVAVGAVIPPGGEAK